MENNGSAEMENPELDILFPKSGSLSDYMPDNDKKGHSLSKVFLK